MKRTYQWVLSLTFLFLLQTVFSSESQRIISHIEFRDKYVEFLNGKYEKPSDPYNYIGLGFFYAAVEDWKEAEENFDKAFEILSTLPKFSKEILSHPISFGIQQYHMGNYSGAKKTLENVLKHLPDNDVTKKYLNLSIQRLENLKNDSSKRDYLRIGLKQIERFRLKNNSSLSFK